MSAHDDHLDPDQFAVELPEPTKGPWTVSSEPVEGECDLNTIEAQGRVLARLPGTIQGTSDALLMAAGPAMRDALLLFLRDDGLPDQPRRAMAAARAALRIACVNY